MTSGRGAVAVPVLPVQDLERSVAWYERLGFEVLARFDEYAIAAFDGAELHLVTFDVEYPPMSLSGAYLRVADADVVFERWTALGAPVVAAPEDQPYGIREWATEDLDGNLWRVGSPVAALAETIGVADDSDRSSDREEGATATTESTETAGPTDGDELPARALGAEIRDEAHSLGRLLAGADDDAVRVRGRGREGSWSALEHGVHVRDRLTVCAEQVVRTLAEHEPELGPSPQDHAIHDGMANESDASAVVDDLGRNAAKVSEALRMVDDESWGRGARLPDGGRTTIEALARDALDSVVRHRLEAERALHGDR